MASDGSAGTDGDFSLSQASLANLVMEALSQEILSGRLLPGERLDLRHYAARWKVSITPMRDAVKNLEALGFLTVLARRGVYVAQLSVKDVKDLFDVRVALEGEAVRLAAPRMPQDEAQQALALYRRAGEIEDAGERDRLLPEVDMLVHTLVMRYCDNARLKALMESMTAMVRWTQNTIIQNLDEPFRTTLPEHIAICQALCERDVDRAVAAMRAHLLNTSRRIEAFLALAAKD